MTDPFGSTSDSVTAPARQAFAITPDDNAELSTFAKAIYVGRGGDVMLRAVGSESDVTFVNVGGGTILDVRCRAIRVTGTTAAEIVGLA
ncbi:spike base protein, RCAP_Rcc01079 family [Erythrobacter sp. Alg231-14]|uniref:spike base protein, RCAP_Rcc01079 family n=1 Tax=Erythrobacter sp. Alg231-14 TaxID=1922225 RepID=UPI000D54E689